MLDFPGRRGENAGRTLRHDFVVRRLARGRLTADGAGHAATLTLEILFEANREVIQDPDKIYPGQKIRIPLG